MPIKRFSTFPLLVWLGFFCELVYKFDNEDTCRDNDAKIKGEYEDVSGRIPKDVRKKKRMRRIEEYKKFKANCQRLKKFMSENHALTENNRMETKPETNWNKKTRSLNLKDARSKVEILHRRCFSMPNLNQNLTLKETILLWGLKKDR